MSGEQWANQQEIARGLIQVGSVPMEKVATSDILDHELVRLENAVEVLAKTQDELHARLAGLSSPEQGVPEEKHLHEVPDSYGATIPDKLVHERERIQAITLLVRTRLDRLVI